MSDPTADDPMEVASELVDRLYVQARYTPEVRQAVDRYAEAFAEIVHLIMERKQHVELINMVLTATASMCTIALPPKEVLKVFIESFARTLETQYMVEKAVRQKREQARQGRKPQ